MEICLILSCNRRGGVFVLVKSGNGNGVGWVGLVPHGESCLHGGGSEVKFLVW